MAEYKIQYLSPPIIDEVENWKLSELAENQELVYCIVNNELVQQSLNSRELIYLNFLNYYELLSIVIQKAIDLKLLPPDTRLSPKYVYFSPYKEEIATSSQLSGESYYNLLSNSSSATSRSTTSLIQLASIYFAQKRRKYEMLATTQGYEKDWDADEEVKLVTKHLKKLGYSWNVELKHANTNTYEIILLKIQENTKFSLHQASSGEKEILNFLLGIFAYNI